jgi:hypothetical protein
MFEFEFPTATTVDDASAAAPHDDALAAPDASAELIPADGDVLPSQLSPDNANELALTFGRPIGSVDDQRWRFGRRSMHERGYGRDDALPIPGDVDNWGRVDNWIAPSSRPQAPVVHKRDWYGTRCGLTVCLPMSGCDPNPVGTPSRMTCHSRPIRAFRFENPVNVSPPLSPASWHYRHSQVSENIQG